MMFKKNLGEIILNEFTDVEHVAFRSQDKETLGVICFERNSKGVLQYYVLCIDLRTSSAWCEQYNGELGDSGSYDDNRQLVTDLIGKGARKVNIPYLKEWNDGGCASVYVVSLNGKRYTSFYCEDDDQGEICDSRETPIAAALACEDFLDHICYAYERAARK